MCVSGIDRGKSFLVLLLCIFCFHNAFAGGKVVVEGKGFSVTSDYFKLLLEGMPSGARGELKSDSLKLSKYLKFLAEVEAFSKLAKSAGLDKDPVLKAQMELCRKKVLAIAMLDKKVNDRMKSFKLTDEDLKLYYFSHSNEFMNGSKLLPFEKVKWIIRDKLYRQKREEVAAEVIAEVLGKFDVEFHPDNIEWPK